jgi:glycosyltransferase involved in cell wall biosynthesis
MIINKPIKLAVIIDQAIYVGGGYQQSINDLLLLSNISNDLIQPIYYSLNKKNLEALSKININVFLLQENIFQKFHRYLRNSMNNTTLKYWSCIFKYNYFEKIFHKNNVNLIYFLSPSKLVYSLESINFIFTIWDFCHRDFVEFPEVYINRNFEYREKLYSFATRKAVATLVDSEKSKQKLVFQYGIDPDRVIVFPFSPASHLESNLKNYNLYYIDIKSKYNIQNDYIFYPAQFWPHKNHIYILEGLNILKNMYNLEIDVIFTGTDKGNMDYIKKCAKDLNLTKRVHFLGFVDDCEMIYLYKQSLSLVMPTYFGPTNLPPLEASYLGVPIMYSNLSGLTEQVGNSALLMDLNDPISLAQNIFNLSNNNSLKNSLIKNAYENLKNFDTSNKCRLLVNLFVLYQSKRKCWI